MPAEWGFVDAVLFIPPAESLVDLAHLVIPL